MEGLSLAGSGPCSLEGGASPLESWACLDPISKEDFIQKPTLWN